MCMQRLFCVGVTQVMFNACQWFLSSRTNNSNVSLLIMDTALISFTYFFHYNDVKMSKRAAISPMRNRRVWAVSIQTAQRVELFPEHHLASSQSYLSKITIWEPEKTRHAKYASWPQRNGQNIKRRFHQYSANHNRLFIFINASTQCKSWHTTRKTTCKS